MAPPINKKGKSMQCKAEYKLLDEDKNLVVIFYCSKEKGHDGFHEHILYWQDDKQESIIGAYQPPGQLDICKNCAAKKLFDESLT